MQQYVFLNIVSNAVDALPTDNANASDANAADAARYVL